MYDEKTMIMEIIPNCITNIRSILKSMPTKIDILRIKRLIRLQKILATHIISEHGYFKVHGPSTYYRIGIRYNKTHYVDQETYDRLGFSPVRNNPRNFIENEKRLNKIYDVIDEYRMNRNDVSKLLYNNNRSLICQICLRPTTKCKCKQIYLHPKLDKQTQYSIEYGKKNNLFSDS
ncbi:unnamed protein product [Didymodactylos carnosus]|uniref:Uncharacterized protein n=1 Tax=Didymodactylos carnosus TaxID=1234261 RepID=A0A814ZVD7_9BILA|nr:unnamed protein product [Didymodactylos carnosus]CAF4017107.1 unnamed protein product [Didymodactylos carnosus]